MTRLCRAARAGERRCVRDDVAMIPDLEWIEAELLGLLEGADTVEPVESAESSGSRDSEG